MEPKVVSPKLGPIKIIIIEIKTKFITSIPFIIFVFQNLSKAKCAIMPHLILAMGKHNICPTK
jgi:hypothetical protein